MNPSPEFNRFGGSSTNMKGKRALTIVIKLGLSSLIFCLTLPPLFSRKLTKGEKQCFFIGTSSICDEKTHEPLLSNLSLLVETAVKLRRDGHRVILVSSGAIGIGLRRLDIEKRPKHLAAAQVCSDPSLWVESWGLIGA